MAKSKTKVYTNAADLEGVESGIFMVSNLKKMFPKVFGNTPFPFQVDVTDERSVALFLNEEDAVEYADFKNSQVKEK